MSSRDDELPVIDADLLNSVTGGTATDDKITQALQSIQKSVDCLKQSNKPNWFRQMVPLLLFSMMTSNRGGCSCGYPGPHYH